MKEIQLKVSGIIKPTPGQPVNLGEAVTNQNTSHKNAMKISWSALTIENHFEEIISSYLFQRSADKGQFFRSRILSLLTFEAKRKIVIAVINDGKLLEGEDKSTFERCSKQIISLRNAHTHGEVIEKSEGAFITYFEGKPCEDKLSDNYWSDVEKEFEEINNLFTKIEKST